MKLPESHVSLTVDVEAGDGVPGSVRVGVELAGVARLVLHFDLLDGQSSLPQRGAQADPTFELLPQVRAQLGVRGDRDGVTLFRRFPPQSLGNPFDEGVRAGQGDGQPTYGRLVPLQVDSASCCKEEEQCAGFPFRNCLSAATHLHGVICVCGLLLLLIWEFNIYSAKQTQ